MYFIAEMKPPNSINIDITKMPIDDDKVSIDFNNKEQTMEIGEINWYNKEQIISLMRPYNHSRKLVFEDACKYFNTKNV